MKSPSKRWTVERKADEFETVLASRMDVEGSGALRFYNGDVFDPREVIVIAPVTGSPISRTRTHDHPPHPAPVDQAAPLR